MLSSFNSLMESISGFGDALGFLPAEYSSIIVAVLGLAVSWAVISLGIKIIGTFF